MHKYQIIFITLIISGLLLSGCTNRNKTEEERTTSASADPLLERLDQLTKQIQSDSSNAEYFHERALFYYDNEEYNDALKDIWTALEIDSTYAEYHVTLAEIYLGMGKMQACFESLEKAIELDNENVRAHLKQAEINIVFHKYKEALQSIDKVIQIDELEAKAYFLRGVVLLENADTVRGIRNFQKAIDVDQDYFDAHLQLGLLYAGKKNKLAVDYFNNALNIDPGNREVTYYLALYHQETGSYDLAIQLYNSILENDPEFYFAIYNIGYICLVYLQDFEQAIEYFTQALEIDPEYAEAYYNRGFAYELLNDVENSRKDYKKTLELSPNYEKAIDGLNRIDEYLLQQNQSGI
jgi:tetratricopeptide (TPR) repeat protein